MLLSTPESSHNHLNAPSSHDELPESSLPSTIPGMTIRCAILDDHHVVRDALGLMLGAEPDFEVVGACDTERELLDIVRLHKPDVLMLNLDLPRCDAFEAAEAELEAVGLGARRHHYPAQMSGGEQQRVALARAAAPRPRILLADEPTGNLDGTNGQAIMDLLFGLRDRHGATLVLVTHAPELAARCDRVAHLRDGLIERVEAGA